MKRKWLPIMIVLVAVLALAVYNLAPFSPHVASAAQQPATPTNLTGGSNAPLFAGPADLETAFENIYTQVNPSVVSIETATRVQTTTPNLPFGFPRNPQGNPQAPLQSAMGSGFVWNTDGYVVTNNHVVENADRISVIFADGATVSAKLVGADPDSDLAVLKVDAPASQLRPVQMGDSTRIKVGQLAIAIGNPFGEENTMTTGIISALGRSLPVNQNAAQGPSYTIPDVIQTDAPINPGNSGGVLLNIQGQVIGVTSAIESPVRASSGVGFAIPAAIVQRVVPALIKTGRYDHAYLGLSGTTLTPAIAQAMGLKPDQRGALVIDVTTGGPSEKAGIKGSTQQATVDGVPARVGGDVVTAIDTQVVKSFDDIVAYLARATDVNQTVALKVLRGNQEQTIKVTLAARPTSEPAARSNPPSNPTASGASLGITGGTLTPEIAQAMNLPANQQGVLIDQVSKGSAAEKAGLQGNRQAATINGRSVSIGGDVIVALDGQAVKTIGDLQNALRQVKPGQVVTLSILRNGKAMDVKVTLDGRL